jgi:hypothetical protein
MTGRSKKFKEKEFEEYVYNYLEEKYNEIKSKDAELPTIYGCFRYIRQFKDCSFRTVRRCFEEYWTDIKKEFEFMRADLLVIGAAKNRYNIAIVIFALKNWCKWKDNQNEEHIQDNTINIVMPKVENND